MAAVDEIDALEKSIKDITSQLSQARTQLVTLRKQMTEAAESKKKANEGARLMWNKLLEIKQADIVSIKEYSEARALFYRNKDLASSKAIAMATIRSSIAKIERSIPMMEFDVSKLTETRAQYGQVRVLRS